MSQSSIINLRHPYYSASQMDWSTWRSIWEGGDDFVWTHLQKTSGRESQSDYESRRSITPVPGFAKAAITDIKNAVFHRMGDIVRRGGSSTYQNAVKGFKGGVDRQGASMNHYLGTEIIPEMLLMGKVGVFVDNLAPAGPTLADASQASPYVYTYRCEDILSWNTSKPGAESDFSAILLRDWVTGYDSSYAGIELPAETQERLRLIWIGDDGFVRYQFFNADGDTIDGMGQAIAPSVEGGIKTSMRRIPFVMADIGQSLMRDIAKHQIALLNLCSTDVAYALKANFPFYTEQQDGRAIGAHLKGPVMEDGTSSSGGQKSGQKEVKVGSIDGRIYDIQAERPGFINPSAEPLRVSMELQRKLEDDIRKLVNLSVVALGSSRASGDARSFDNQGLEAGLAYIGLVLETAERKIADHWSMYEGNDKRDNVVISYPDRYTLKTADDRIEEAEKLTNLMFSIPGNTVKKELAKDAVAALLGARVDPDTLKKIYVEVDGASFSTSDPEVIRLAKEEGLASDITLSNALGFDGEKEIPQAKKDHAERVKVLAEAQSAGKPQPEDNPAARGIKDLSPDNKGAAEEKKNAVDATGRVQTRGKGKSTKK